MAVKNLGRVKGEDGKSAYEIWLEQGNTGSEQDFLDSLIGEEGKGISKIEKTNTVGLIDTYTITYTDGTTSTYEVKNGTNGSGEGGTSDHSQLENLDYEKSGHTGFQKELINGENIKTINGQNILGSGNVDLNQIVSSLPSTSEAIKNAIYVVNGNGTDLPEGYTPLEAIKTRLGNNIGSYIELPFKYNTSTKFEIDTKLNITRLNGSNPQGIGWDYGGMIGCKGGSSLYGDGTNETTFSYGSTVIYNQIINGTSTETSIIDETGEKTDLSRTNSLATYATQNYTIGKITRKTESYYPGEIIFYYLKVKINDVLIYDLVPATRNSDSVAGLYDIINNVFYSSNDTSVDFIGISFGSTPYIFDGTNYIKIGSGSGGSEATATSSNGWVNPEIKKFNLIAHRGLHSTEVEHENTIEAFEKAYQAGYKYIECDVIPTTDGFVIHHDKTVEGYTLTSMTTDAVIDALPYVPTVESVIKWAKKRNVCVDLDTAGRVTGDQLSALYALVKKYNMLGNVVFTSYQDNIETLKSNGETNCNVCLTYMNTTPTADLIKAIPKSLTTAFNHFEISINYTYLTNSNMIEVCHERNLWCRTWTLTSEASCLTFINMGIDKIFVDADDLWELNE